VFSWAPCLEATSETPEKVNSLNNLPRNSEEVGVRLSPRSTSGVWRHARAFVVRTSGKFSIRVYLRASSKPSPARNRKRAKGNLSLSYLNVMYGGTGSSTYDLDRNASRFGLMLPSQYSIYVRRSSMKMSSCMVLVQRSAQGRAYSSSRSVIYVPDGFPLCHGVRSNSV